MRVVILSTRDQGGGAFLAAYRLHRGFLEAGIVSRMLVRDKETDDPTVVALPRQRIHSPFHDLLIRGASRMTGGPRLTLPLLGRRRIEQLPLLQQTDVVLLGSINASGITPSTVGQLARLRKPVVWRLSDMWPFTGGCHYSGECERYQRQCGNCPLMRRRLPWDPSRLLLWQKRRMRRKSGPWLAVISPSQWLAERARKSAVFRDVAVEHIPPGVDCRRVKPMAQHEARELLGLPQNAPVVGFGAFRAAADPRKGLTQLERALERLGEQKGMDDVQLALFGSWNSTAVHTPFPTHAMGLCRPDFATSVLYSAVDVFAAPSIEENAPNTVLESLACGTPVVAFSVGGIPELIEHRRNGGLAAPFDQQDFAAGLRWGLGAQAGATGDAPQGAGIREDICQRWDIRKTVEAYCDTFEKLMAAPRER